MTERIFILLALLQACWVSVNAKAEELAAPRVDWVVMVASQPIADRPSTIWYDDFDGAEKPYTESEGPVVSTEAFGGSGRSMLSQYNQGSRGVGNRKVFFGDSPSGKVVRRGDSFDDVYWRISGGLAIAQRRDSLCTAPTKPDVGFAWKLVRS